MRLLARGVYVEDWNEQAEQAIRRLYHVLPEAGTPPLVYLLRLALVNEPLWEDSPLNDRETFRLQDAFLDLAHRDPKQAHRQILAIMERDEEEIPDSQPALEQWAAGMAQAVATGDGEP